MELRYHAINIIEVPFNSRADFDKRTHGMYATI